MRQLRVYSVVFACVLAAVLMAAVKPAYADIPMYLTSSKEVKIDGVLDDWGSGSFVNLGVVQRGTARDFSVRMAVAYDDKHVYVAASIRGHAITRTAKYGDKEDHAEFAISFPDARGNYARVYEVKLFAGKPGELEGQVRAVGAGVVRGAQIVEAPARNGYTFEAKIPWSLYAPAAHTRVKMRGNFSYFHGNGKVLSDVVALSDATRASSMPLLLTAPEMSLINVLSKQHGVSSASVDVITDVAGDEMKERVMLVGNYLVVLGPRFRKGTEYLWSDVGVDVGAGQLPMFEVRDLTGDGKAEITMRKRVGRGEGWRELVQVLTFRGDKLMPVFEHETGLSSSIGTIENRVSLVPDGHKVAIEIALGTDTGYDASNFREPMETEREALLLPWGTVQSKRYVWDGAKFSKQREQKKKPGSVSKGRAPSEPISTAPMPRAPSQDELLDQVFALYKKDRNIPAHAPSSFDFVTDVAADEQLERIVCHGRDLVVFGKGFREGRGYVSLSMPQFALDADIVHVSAYDLTGDGKAEIIVRGVQRAAAPPELGAGELVREVLFIYGVDESRIERVFAAETAVSLGRQRVHSLVAFVPSSRGVSIELRPGRAIGWSRSTWPYRQDTELVSGLEPLILPWTPEPVTFRYSQGMFTR